MALKKLTASVIGMVALLAVHGAVAAQEPAPAGGDKWTPVAKTDNQEAFVNAATLAVVGGFVEARVKLNFTQPQPSAKKGKTYLSARNTYRFDCAQRRLAMKELKAYAGADLQGDLVQKAKSGDKNLQWLDAPESTVFGELLDFACKKSQ